MKKKTILMLCAVFAASGCATVQGPLPAEQSPPSARPSHTRPAADVPAAGPAAEKAESEQIAKPTLVKGSDQMFKPPRAQAPADVRGADVSLKFDQAPITDVLHVVLGDILNVPYAIVQPVVGTITIQTQAPLRRNEVLPVLESLLRANGILIVRDASGVYHAGRAESLKGLAPAFGTVGALPPGHSMVIVPLQFIGASEMADILKPVAAPESFVRVDGFRNLLILAGTRPQLEGWLDIVSTFDVDVLKGMSIGLFPLKYASVGDVEVALKALLAGSAAGGAPAAAGGVRVSRAAGTQGGADAMQAKAPETVPLQLPGPLGSVVQVVGIERLNALLVVTSRAYYLDQAREWIEKFDQPRDSGGELQLFVYPVQNGTAAHLAGLLSALFGGKAQPGVSPRTDSGVAPGLAVGSLGDSGMNLGRGLRPSSGTATSATAEMISQVALGADVRVVADEQTNALLIHAPRSEYRKIESALKRLDIAPLQVLIEASILEVTLNDELRYGLQWFIDGGLGNGYTGTAMLNSATSGGIGPAQPGFSYTIANSAGQIRAVLNALAQKSLINVISSPSVLVLDNQTAAIQVGDQQPIRSSLTVTEGGVSTSSIQYKDTGVMLSVTPSVNAGGMVAMTVNQTVTDVGQVDVATGQRSFLQRQVASRIAVRSGETVVLGGLIRDNANRGKQGVPLLQDIPLLGNLFATTTDTGVRTELLVMITPRVLQDDQQLRDISGEMRERMAAALKILPGLSTDGAVERYLQDLEDREKRALPPAPVLAPSAVESPATVKPPAAAPAR